MSHIAEEWIDRFGRQHRSCAECEEPWPCRESKVKPAGWLLPGYSSAQAAVEMVAHGFGVSVADIMSDERTRHVLIARHCAMAVVKAMTPMSYAAIGGFFGKNHSTVINAISRVTGDPELAAGVDAVVAELRPAPRLAALPTSTTDSQGYATSAPQVFKRTIGL